MNELQYAHRDVLGQLNEDLPIGKKLAFVHEVLQSRFSFIHRVAVAVYDNKTDSLKSFVDSGLDHPIQHYEAHLSDVPSLQEVLEVGRPRVVSDLGVFHTSHHAHTEKLKASGYQSSYTLPMYLDGAFFGFIFFNSHEKEPFCDDALHYMDLFGHLISLVVINEVSAIHTLMGALKTAREMTHQRDTETGAHLDRMSRYAEIIARELADDYGFDDDYIEHVFLFAPLHDIGKIGIPDSILLKPGKLTVDEFEVMKGHVQRGKDIIDRMLENFSLEGFKHIEVLRNITHYHHEAMNGTGYPSGLSGKSIPIEARIVAVADVFDALTSRRPYKEAWTTDDAFAALHRLAGSKLDKECVAALEVRRSEAEEIMERFKEDRLG